jgi:hypothetical protein
VNSFHAGSGLAFFESTPQTPQKGVCTARLYAYSDVLAHISSLKGVIKPPQDRLCEALLGASAVWIQKKPRQSVYDKSQAVSFKFFLLFCFSRKRLY